MAMLVEAAALFHGDNDDDGDDDDDVDDQWFKCCGAAHGFSKWMLQRNKIFGFFFLTCFF
jgi:hypothetical protein